MSPDSILHKKNIEIKRRGLMSYPESSPEEQMAVNIINETMVP